MILILICLSLILPVVSAQQVDMGVFQQGSCIDLIQLCGDCTYNNVSSIIYPNVTKDTLDAEMTQRGTEFNYTYCFPNITGEYLINGVGDLGGDDTVWAYTLMLTPNGDLPTTPKLLFHYGSIFILFLFFTFAIIGLVSYDHYISKFIFYWISHILLIAITFMLWNGSLNLLTSAPFVTGFFRIMFYFFSILVFPMVLVSMAWIFYIHLTNDEIMSMMERGMDEDEAVSRVKSRRNGGRR